MNEDPGGFNEMRLSLDLVGLELATIRAERDKLRKACEEAKQALFDGVETRAYNILSDSLK